MSAQSNAPTIIKKKKVVSGDGHHGGAWKVAMTFSYVSWRFCAKWPNRTDLQCGVNAVLTDATRSHWRCAIFCKMPGLRNAEVLTRS